MNGVNKEDTDTEDELEECGTHNHNMVTSDGSNRFSNDGEPEFKPRKDNSDSSDTEEESERKTEDEDEEIDAKSDIDVNDGCIASKIEADEQVTREVHNDDNDDRSLSDSSDEESKEPVKHEDNRVVASPESEEDDPIEINEHDEDFIVKPKDEDISEEDSEDDEIASKNNDEFGLNRSPSPEPAKHPDEYQLREQQQPSPLQRSPSPERKDSRGSSSYDEERASSMSPEPPRAITSPPGKLASPTSSSQNKDITKIYTEALVSETMTPEMKAGPDRSANDITQIYTQSLDREQTKAEPAKFTRPNKDITQLYTAAFNKEANTNTTGKGEAVKPRRNDNITKLYTGVFDSKEQQKTVFKGKPSDEKTNPRKHNMSTVMDKEAIKEAYNSVLGDNNGIDWAAFKFDGQNLGVTATGQDFDTFKSQFGVDDRGFGYIRVKTGDEMSKRSKFVLVTWVGPNVSVMKKAKMSTDKALMKEVIQNLSVELQLETLGEFSMEHFKAEVDKAGGARYGTGVRDL
jgi:hypothetical protein